MRLNFIVPPSAQPSPQAKRQIDRFSRFHTAHGRKPILLMGDHFSKIAFSMGDLDLIVITWASLNTQSKRQHDGFKRFRTGNRRVSLYFTVHGLPFPLPLKIAPSREGI